LLTACVALLLLQLVDRLDQGAFSSGAPGQLTYQGLYKLVSKALYRAHVEGKLKREIIQVRCCGWQDLLILCLSATICGSGGRVQLLTCCYTSAAAAA
jgi:hypothetical protein